MAKEIERKYVLTDRRLPSYVVTENSRQIHQTYLAIGKEEVRVRKTIKEGQETHTMTIKKGSGLTREEIEFEIDVETYNQLLEGENRKPLIKTRRTMHLLGYEFDCDIYENAAIEGLQTFEVEFASEEEALAFEAPKWLEEVTGDKRYKNQNLWKEIQ